MKNKFDIPVTLFLFRRTNTLSHIIGRISEYAPSRIYLVADGGRNTDEQKECEECRQYAESLIDWDCNVIKNYAPSNRGVYKNIGEGAKWVLSQEKWSIFLEDDNLPEESFFPYCEELLIKYETAPQVLWICGTNYMGKYETNYSYMFTKHMLPCGWASWSDKFLKYYDGMLNGLNDRAKLSTFKKSFLTKGCRARNMYHAYLYHIRRSKFLVDQRINEASWDYQMAFSVRANEMYGIAPAYNQIKNIGIDDYSIHGGNVIDVVSVHCGMDSYPLSFPLRHPNSITTDIVFEKENNRLLKPSIFVVPYHFFAMVIKKFLGLNKYDSLKKYRKNHSKK